MSRPPADKFVQDTLDNNYYTPDMAALYKRRWSPLFVYGTLKQGFSRNTSLHGSIYLGPAYTRNTGWLMYSTKQRYPFPIVLPAISQLVRQGTQMPTPGGIQGELYLVSPKHIQSLDFIESNGITYQRVTRLIDLPNEKGQPNVILTAQMYIGTLASWRSSVLKGMVELCDYYTRNKNNKYGYYTFTKKTIERCAAVSATTHQKLEANF